jgi:hypothetical protein
MVLATEEHRVRHLTAPVVIDDHLPVGVGMTTVIGSGVSIDRSMRQDRVKRSELRTTEPSGRLRFLHETKGACERLLDRVEGLRRWPMASGAVFKPPLLVGPRSALENPAHVPLLDG